MNLRRDIIEQEDGELFEDAVMDFEISDEEISSPITREGDQALGHHKVQRPSTLASLTSSSPSRQPRSEEYKLSRSESSTSRNRTVDIQSQDIKVGDYPQHPGNVTLQRIVAAYARSYAKARQRTERRLRIYQNVLSEVETTTTTYTSPRFIVPDSSAMRSQGRIAAESEVHFFLEQQFQSQAYSVIADESSGTGSSSDATSSHCPPRPGTVMTNDLSVPVAEALSVSVTSSMPEIPFVVGSAPIPAANDAADTIHDDSISQENDDGEDTTQFEWERSHDPEHAMNHYHHQVGACPMPPPTCSLPISSQQSETYGDTTGDGTSNTHDDTSQHQHSFQNLGLTSKPAFLARQWKATLVVGVLLLILIMGVVISLVVTSGDNGDGTNGISQNASAGSDDNSSITLATIQERGYLTCGVPNHEGYAIPDENGNWVGFEVDLCRAVAAGIFGQTAFSSSRDRDEPVEFVHVETKERFTKLDQGEIDLLLAITTHNMERDVYEPSTRKGYSFSRPYLVNGLIFAGDPEFLTCVDSSYSGGEQRGNLTNHCEDARLCVLDATTHKDIILELLPTLSIGNLVTPTTLETFYDHFFTGVCNLLVGEQFDVGEAVVVGRLQYEGPYDVGTQFMSKELIAMVTRDDDARWSDYVDWILQGLLSAEEIRLIRSSESADPKSLDTTLVFGEDHKTMFQDAVAVVGDYGELYERHLQNIVPRLSANRINLGNTPGLYATSLGAVTLAEAPSGSSRRSSKIQSIKDRGHLNCGINKMPIFADLRNDVWTGLDISFCKAIAAAMFDGKIEIRYNVLDPSDRFIALDSGRVDVLAAVTTRTLERDVKESQTGKGFTFSFPNFHDNIRFAGMPSYLRCAENLDWTSESCRDYRVCVTASTTQHDIVQRLFPREHLVVLGSNAATAEAFGSGRFCQVLAGGMLQVAAATIEEFYDGDYEVGSDILSREALALVTTEDDVLWSKLVNWVVNSLFYAEEQSISQSTYLRMPRVDFFRPLLGNEFLRYAIRAVGSYRDIWEETARENLEREGRNLLNTDPLSPLLMTDLTWDLPIRE